MQPQGSNSTGFFLSLLGAGLVTAVGLFGHKNKKLTRRERLQKIGFDLLAVPDEYCCASSHEILERPINLGYPVEKNESKCFEQSFLQGFWAKKGEKIDPHTNILIRTEFFDYELDKEIENFVKTQEWIFNYNKEQTLKQHKEKQNAQLTLETIKRLLNQEGKSETEIESILKQMNGEKIQEHEPASHVSPPATF